MPLTRAQKDRWLIDHLKSVPCTDCGQTYGPWVMQFDHVRGLKLANVSDLVGAGTPRILAEVEKTDIVCANCHAQREHDRYLDAHVDAALDSEPY